MVKRKIKLRFIHSEEYDLNENPTCASPPAPELPHEGFHKRLFTFVRRPMLRALSIIFRCTGCPKSARQRRASAAWEDEAALRAVDADGQLELESGWDGDWDDGEDEDEDVDEVDDGEERGQLRYAARHPQPESEKKGTYYDEQSVEKAVGELVCLSAKGKRRQTPEAANSHPVVFTFARRA